MKNLNEWERASILSETRKNLSNQKPNPGKINELNKRKRTSNGKTRFQTTQQESGKSLMCLKTDKEEESARKVLLAKLKNQEQKLRKSVIEEVKIENLFRILIKN